MKLFLASGSPRRLELLQGAGYSPLRVEQRADEATRPGESAQRYVQRLAEEKAEDALSRLPDELMAEGGVILAADTAVVLAEQILGKPADAEEAIAGLSALAGRPHQVMTGVALIRLPGEIAPFVAVERTEVRFSQLSQAQIRAYVAGGTVFDKAGGYGIQELDEGWVEALDGLKSNVIGLPVERIERWLLTLGVDPDLLRN